MTKDALQQAIDDGLTTWEAATRFGISQTNVRHWAMKYGLRFVRKSAAKKQCRYCNRELNDNRKVYCDNTCQNEYQWQQVKDEIERTGICPHTTQMKAAKRYLIETQGRKCSICGITEWTHKPVPLELDHINGNYEDDRVCNLRMICGNCGMLLPTYKGRNTGNGRYKRRQRYKNGQSY